MTLFAGIAISSEIRRHNQRRLRCMEALLDMMRSIQLKIDCYAIPIPEILAECDERTLIDCGISGGKCSSLDDLYQQCRIYMGKPEGYILKEFCSSIGCGYRETEVKLCEKYISELNAIKNEYRVILPKVNKAATVLCFCILGILILLIA